MMRRATAIQPALLVEPPHEPVPRPIEPNKGKRNALQLLSVTLHGIGRSAHISREDVVALLSVHAADHAPPLPGPDELPVMLAIAVGRLDVGELVQDKRSQVRIPS